ncbi:3'-5' exonuclease [Vaginella massiliensis]|uniref:3'-5' exonuclease n=1 Tax=Vaginella massiliensis TaxID=1816680 RepID=UPI000837ECAF|nr:3'-5' exonuclease [Vaginella massiliensis]
MKPLSLNKILFLDIETVPEFSSWNLMEERAQKLWTDKTAFQRKDEISPEEFYHEKAGIYAEFGKIICISCGIIHQDRIRIKSFYGHNEEKLLNNFAQLLQERYQQEDQLLCAHNGKEFDFPYMARRLLIHQIPIPNILQLQGKKPWEIQHLDTMDMWKFGDYKHYTSLDLLAHVLGIDTPKDDIDGSQVASVYYTEKDLDRIVRYCEKDVVTLINIFLRMHYMQPIERE